MKKLLILIGLNFVLLISSFGQTDIYDSIYVGNVWRKYNIHLPLGYNSNTNYPLILGFHGGQQAATSSQGWTVFAYQSKLSEKADNSNFIVVYPEGLVFNQIVHGMQVIAAHLQRIKILMMLASSIIY